MTKRGGARALDHCESQSLRTFAMQDKHVIAGNRGNISRGLGLTRELKSTADSFAKAIREKRPGKWAVTATRACEGSRGTAAATRACEGSRRNSCCGVRGD